MKQTSIYCMVWYINLKDDIFNMVISQYLLWNNSSHRGHWWCRLQPTSSIITDAKLVDSNLYNFARQGWCRLNREADVITGLSRRHPCRLQRVISRYLQDITTDLSCTAQRVLITILMQKTMPKYACLPSEIVEVWIDRFCVRYDWWRRLKNTRLTHNCFSDWIFTFQWSHCDGIRCLYYVDIHIYIYIYVISYFNF